MSALKKSNIVNTDNSVEDASITIEDADNTNENIDNTVKILALLLIRYSC